MSVELRARVKSWSIDYWEALHPYSLGGVYVNLIALVRSSRVEERRPRPR